MEEIVREIYEQLGPGHRECVYHRAFELELRMRKIPYECEVVVPVFYKGQFLSHIRIDLLVDKTTIVELKAIRSLKDEEIGQIERYMNVLNGARKGYLVNFGSPKGVEIRSFEKNLDVPEIVGLHAEEQSREE
jgi:GxxExxY protein